MKFEPVIKWSGSKRALSEEILKYVPKEIDTYYEPFCGGCSMLFQLLHSDVKCNKYICSDANEHVINFFNELKRNPIKIYEEYKVRWDELCALEDIPSKKDYYNTIRERFNNTKDVHDFVFLSRTCVNGLTRYNSKGEFNSAFHLTRNGINPKRYKKILLQWSNKINEYDVQFICRSYEDVKPTNMDFVFLDPPYANTKAMYFGGIDLDLLWDKLRTYECSYALTFNGKRTNNDTTYSVPMDVYSKHVYLDGKISGFKKLQDMKDYVNESLYVK